MRNSIGDSIFADMKFLIKVISTTLAVFLIATLMPGVEVQNLPMALLVSLILVLINVYIKPILIFLTFPITVVTLGLFLLVINAFIILFTSYILKDGFKVDGFWVALLFSIVLSMLTSLIDRLTERDPDER
jgi:putative membrane protein